MTQAVARIHPRIVILAAFWADPDTQPPAAARGGAERDPEFGRNLRATLRGIRAEGRQICLVRDVPRFRYRVAHALVMAHRRGIEPTFNTLTLSDARRQQSAFDSEFDRLQNEKSFVSVNLREKLCASGTCLMLDSAGMPLYSDESHLTPFGARMVEPDIEQCFDGGPNAS